MKYFAFVIVFISNVVLASDKLYIRCDAESRDGVTYSQDMLITIKSFSDISSTEGEKDSDLVRVNGRKEIDRFRVNKKSITLRSRGYTDVYYKIRKEDLLQAEPFMLQITTYGEAGKSVSERECYLSKR